MLPTSLENNPWASGESEKWLPLDWAESTSGCSHASHVDLRCHDETSLQQHAKVFGVSILGEHICMPHCLERAGLSPSSTKDSSFLSLCPAQPAREPGLSLQQAVSRCERLNQPMGESSSYALNY